MNTLNAQIQFPPIEQWLSQRLAHSGWNLALAILGSLAILIIGVSAARWVARLLRRAMDRVHVQPIVASFVTNLAKAVMIVLVVIAAIANLGIPLAPILAVLGAAGLAVGLALQSTLSHLASGVLLAILRPFNVGDFIEVSGLTGTVEAMHIFQTRLVTPDNRVVIMPNSVLTNSPLINYTQKGIRRLDLVYSVSYDDDLAQVKALLENILASDSRVLKEPAPVVGVSAYADSSINFVVRPWAKVQDYWPLTFDLNQRIKEHFDAAGITIPFPQRVVHTVSSPPPRGASSGGTT